MDHYKIYCQEHAYEQIINFCADPHCLTALCATCICDHTRIHLQRGTSPRYENIKNTYTRYNQIMRQQILTIEEDKEWLNAICSAIDQKRKNVIFTLSKAREDCLKLVNKHFDDLQEQISYQIVADSKKNSLHSTYRLEALNSMILKEISSLLLHSQDLYSPKFIEAAKLAEEEIFPRSRDFHLKICKQLKLNEVYSVNAIYQQNFFESIALQLKKLISLQILLPREQNVENPLKLQRFESQRRHNSVRKMNSSLIVTPNTSNFGESTSKKPKRISGLMPKHTTSILMPENSSPLQQIQQLMSRQNQVSSPVFSKGSRFSSALTTINQSKHQFTHNEIKQITNSQVSYNSKQNQSLAFSIFLEPRSNQRN